MQWPVPYSAKLGDVCAESGEKVVVTGTSEELLIVEQVRSEMKYPATIVAVKTTPGSKAALIRDAFALISNCTGPSHISAATETPSIIISMDGKPERWAPLNSGLHFPLTGPRRQIVTGLFRLHRT